MLNLSQRGRAAMQFLGSLQQYSSGALRDQAQREFEAELVSRAPAMEPVRHREDVRVLQRLAEKSTAYRFERLLQRYVAEEVYVRAIPAIEEQRDKLPAISAAVGARRARVELDPGLVLPDYYRDVEWHCQPGGVVEGYDLSAQMFAAAIVPHVFRYGGFAALDPGADLREHRARVLSALPKQRYEVIYEPGCGGVTTLAAAAAAYPQAELIGSDLSADLLTSGAALAEILGLELTLKQRDARDTRESDESVDAVILYAVLHEMPTNVAEDVVREAFRILRPGGDILVADIPPFSACPPFFAVLFDWETENREEPYVSEFLELDREMLLASAGFDAVRDFSLSQSKNPYPWVTVASKPRG